MAYLKTDNSLNDTSRVKIVKTVFFDTSATLIHGYIVDSAYRPILNSEVTLFFMDDRYELLTNSNGEFEIFKNIGRGHWNLHIRHAGFICLYVVNVVQAGGQWFYIKLDRLPH